MKKNLLSKGILTLLFLISVYQSSVSGRNLQTLCNHYPGVIDKYTYPQVHQEEPEKLNVVKAGKEIAELIEKKIQQASSEIIKDKDKTETAKLYVQDRIDVRGDNMEHEFFSDINTKKKKKYTQVEMFVFISLDEDKFSTESMADTLYEKLIQGNEIALDEYQSMGLAVKVKRKKGKIETYIILILEKEN
ncbi:MAG: hypothetical protein M0R38_04835 [Bacteroidia bacterium]|nr:hypothetical protein [Bacteroidia bacterium]